jgi:20S proteasome subunit beta 2
LRRGYVKPNERSKKQKSYVFKRGTTAVLNEKIITRQEISKYVTVHELDGGEAALGEKMDLDV